MRSKLPPPSPPEAQGTANHQWAEMLARWAIPQGIVASAPSEPYFFDPNVFAAAADESLGRRDDSPSDALARDALPSGGHILDVGVGAGAASLRLADRAGSITGVDSNHTLLDEFRARASSLGIAVSTVEGVWPEVEASVPEADVVVCHHVIFNVPDLAAFVSALSAHAARRVVVEITALHPMGWMAPYWEKLHGLRQPDRPTADDAAEVISEAGYRVHMQRWRRRLQMIGESDSAKVERIARRLCLPANRIGELQEVLAEIPPPVERDVVTLWWDDRLGIAGD